ncbi:MAG: leucyl aminopeptidase [Rhodobacteraceae bacterium]|nr:leucyl aminopeptidase [Paracoccaceae bacterium]
MTAALTPSFIETDPNLIHGFEGNLVMILSPEGRMNTLGRRVNKLSGGALARLAESSVFEEMEEGSTKALDFLPGIAATAVIVVKLGKRADHAAVRRAGAAARRSAGRADAMVLAGTLKTADAFVQGFVLAAYEFTAHKTGDRKEAGSLTVMVGDKPAAEAAWVAAGAATEGVIFTRDLVNEPANVLTTVAFADRLLALEEHGLHVSVLEEKDMEQLGMGALLGVGQGSPSPSKIVVMEWNGGRDEAPFCFAGKGVVFDTGGISLKPAGGMKDMTMDMGGAGVVAGVMKTLALRKARANVVGLVGLVENMPDGHAQRPGDVVTSMKGTTIEVANTDAEGRLVLADVLHYAQETYKPAGVINIATLTGAMVIALGHENAGFFSNSDDLSKKLAKAAADTGEGAWRLPVGPGYHKQIESRVADIMNVGGRPAGSITAAAFLECFIHDGMPWCHIDIAGVASLKSATPLGPAGATGWGVRALDRLIADNYEAV